jgi:hypothetical protein
MSSVRLEPAEYPPGIQLDLVPAVGGLTGRWLAAADATGARAVVLPALERHDGTNNWRYTFSDKGGRPVALPGDSAPGAMAALLNCKAPTAHFVSQIFRYRRGPRRWYHHLGCMAIFDGNVWRRLPRDERARAGAARHGGLLSGLAAFLAREQLTEELAVHLPDSVRSDDVVSAELPFPVERVAASSHRITLENARVLGELMWRETRVGDGVEIRTAQGAFVSWAVALERLLLVAGKDSAP